MRTVVIDPGHGGSDPGCVHHGLVEADWTWSLAKRLVDVVAPDEQLRATLTRYERDASMSLRSRCRMANALDADLFLSIHVNASRRPSPRGLWLLHASSAYPETKRAACVVLDHVRQGLAEVVPPAWVDRDPRTDMMASGHGLTVLRSTRMPALLVECGFASNPDDAALIQDETFQELLIGALALGIVRCFRETD